jgi:diguanylate cyclase (GGDEF)-like protein/PAS domain S-box-containing protein
MTQRIKTLLLVEDNAGDARLLREMFNEFGNPATELNRVECMRDAEAYLAANAVDIILLDLGLVDTQGLAAVQRVHAAAPRVPLVVLTGLDDESVAAQAMQEGAEDYLIKGQIESRGLMRSLRYAIERKLLEEALFAEKERALATLNCISDAIACTDMSGNVTFVNLTAESMTGWPSAKAIGARVSDVFRILDDTTRNNVLQTTGYNSAALGTTQLPSNCILIKPDGSEIPIDHSVALTHNSQGRQTGAVIVLRDATSTRAMTNAITHSAQHDFLTGLPNRMLLNDRINQAIAFAMRHNVQVALLFLDLDGFKHINDSLGHAIGDKLLQSIAQRLEATVRASDTVSRQGGDEFVILLGEMKQPQDAVVMARRLLATVERAHNINSHDLQVTASIGVSVYPDDAGDVETLIKNADTAMYQAKENGRQSCQFFKPSMNIRAVERQSIEEDLRRAMSRQEFSLHYQPKISLRTGEITGAEALLRWTHPKRGMVPPSHFIPVAEDCGLIGTIGAWVLREACTQARAWAGIGPGAATMAINVSAIEFRGENFLTNVLHVLNETGLDPRFLELEMTETVLMKQAEATTPILRHLREHGVRVTIDDFGTGFSSLSYLSRFPVDSLKIDQSFVRQIGLGGEETHIVSAVIGMARNLRLRVVAEGVETAEELAFLRDQNCDEAQGFYFSHALPSSAFATLLKTGLTAPDVCVSLSKTAWPKHGHGRR